MLRKFVRRRPIHAPSLGPILIAVLLMLAGVGYAPQKSSLSASSATGVGEWNTYMNNIEHTGYTSDKTFNVQSADKASIRWTLDPNNDHERFDSIFSQPIISQGRVYFGSWDGYEYAVNRSGGIDWQTYLGRTIDTTGCVPPEAGVSSTGTIETMKVGQANSRVLFVGGGDATFYALNAKTGEILWKTPLGSSPSHFLWGSPTVYNGSVYTGMASFGDCPLIRSFVAKLDEQTGEIQGIYYTVPEGCVGAAVWSTPSIDSKTGHMFFDTGNVECESGATTPELEEAMVEVDTATMTLVDYWQVPPAERVADSDWGATATLFDDSSGRALVGAANKNGIFYAFDRSNLGGGPVWQQRISVGGACPQCGEAAIAPAAFDGQYLYAADGKTTIDGQDCGGNVRALRPEDGSVVWATCLVDGSAQFPPSVLGAVTATPNPIIVGSGQAVVLIDKSNGAVLNKVMFSGGDNQPPPPYFWGSASVGDGMIYAGNMSGTFVAIGANQ